MNTIIAMLETVAKRLEELADEFVFVGGATTQLLITDPAVTEIRPTIDIDLIVPVTTRVEYANIEERLRTKGFLNSVIPDAPICRWTVDDVVVDVMPPFEEILGFTNRWYVDALETSWNYRLPSGRTIRVADPVVFVATKIEAFLGRGDGDYIGSSDIEDIIAVIDGRPTLSMEITSAKTEVKAYLRHYFREFLSSDNFRTVVLGYLPRDPIGQRRYQTIIARVEKIASQET